MDDRIVGGRSGPLQIRETPPPNWTAERRKAFLDALATTCNVTLSARRASVDLSGAYRLRKRDPAFAALWSEALEIGYDRLETALLGRALVGVNAIEIEGDEEITAIKGDGDGEPSSAPEPQAPRPGSGVSPPPSASEAQLALAVLNRHRATVEGRRAPHGHRRRATEEETLAALENQLDALARRVRKEVE